MTFRVRAAIIAAVTFCAGAVAVGTTPGLAFEIRNPILNDPEPETVPPADIAEKLPALRAALVAQGAGATHSVEFAESKPVVQPVPEEEAAEDLDFASLSDAVAAQEVTGAVDRELRCVAIGVYYESKGEPLSGQLAVANVILNRAASGRYPSSACAVLTQRSQFSFVRGGRLPTPPNNAAWRRALAVAQVAERNLWENPAPRALFFHANYVSPNWRRPRVATIGNHIFYR